VGLGLESGPPRSRGDWPRSPPSGLVPQGGAGPRRERPSRGCRLLPQQPKDRSRSWKRVPRAECRATERTCPLPGHSPQVPTAGPWQPPHRRSPRAAQGAGRPDGMLFPCSSPWSLSGPVHRASSSALSRSLPPLPRARSSGLLPCWHRSFFPSAYRPPKRDARPTAGDWPGEAPDAQGELTRSGPQSKRQNPERSCRRTRCRVGQ
jgi:hypothetical protein